MARVRRRRVAPARVAAPPKQRVGVRRWRVAPPAQAARELVLRDWDGRQARVVVRLNAPEALGTVFPSARSSRRPAPARPRARRASGHARLRPPAPARARPAPQRLSYSQLTDYAQCGYRFYLRRVLGLPDVTPPVPEVEPEVRAGSTRGCAARSCIARSKSSTSTRRGSRPERDPGLRRRGRGHARRRGGRGRSSAFVHAFADSPPCER